MSAPKFTPGPWRVCQATGGGDVSIEARSAVYRNPIWVARAYGPGYLSGATQSRDANAALIAAAPDLYAALEAFLRAPSVGSDGPGSATIVVQDFNLRAARAALAKARGEVQQ